MDLGPFDVDTAQIQGLGTRFTVFVNRLLASESAAHSLRDCDLSTTANETVLGASTRASGERRDPTGSR